MSLREADRHVNLASLVGWLTMIFENRAVTAKAR